MKCPHCQKPIDVHFVKAPPMQSDSAQSPAKSAPADIDDLEGLLDRINDEGLSGKAVEFVAQVRTRFEKYGKRTMLSEAQMKWLRSISDEQESGESF